MSRESKPRDFEGNYASVKPEVWKDPDEGLGGEAGGGLVLGMGIKQLSIPGFSSE